MMSMNIEFQSLLSILTVMGAGVSVYIGIRVGLAELRRDLRALEKDLEELKNRELGEARARLARLEERYFK